MTDADVAALISALKAYKQADEEGVFVTVSRQACDEAAAALASAQCRIAELTQRVADVSAGNHAVLLANQEVNDRATKAEAERDAWRESARIARIEATQAEAALAAETERCAKVCEADLTMVAWQCADAIRAGAKLRE